MAQSALTEYANESSTEGIDELTGVEATVEAESEATEAGAGEDHTPVSSPTRPTGTSQVGEGGEGEAGGEGSETESEAESEAEAGWTDAPGTRETDPATTEALIEASEADGGREFIAAFAPLLLPLAKTLLPQLAGAAAQAGGAALQKLIASRVARLRRRANPRRETDTEYGDEFGMEASEAQDWVEALSTPEVIIGTDDRLRQKNTQATPWNRICHLHIVAADGSVFLGTGFLIGRRGVVTAGHCVYLHEHGGWARSIEVSPGRNEDTRPYGRITSTAFHSVRGWTRGRKRICDYGFIVLPKAPSPFPGSFGVQARPDSGIKGKILNTGGYPGDKARAGLPGTMWWHKRKATRLEPNVITYDIDTAGGQSGSPVWITSAGSRTVVGIHTNGAPGGNSATRITAPVLANLRTWNQAVS